MIVASPSIAHETIGTERFYRLGWREVLLWASAFVAILVAQAIAAIIVTNWRTQVELPGAPPPAIMIELSDLSVAPQAEDLAVEDGELALPQESVEAAKALPAEAVPKDDIEPLEPLTEPVLEPEPVLETAEAVLPEPPQAVVDPVERLEPTPIEPVVEPSMVPQTVVEPQPIEQLVPDLVEEETAEVSIPMPRPLPAVIEQKRREVAEARERQRQREREARDRQARTEQAEAAASRLSAPRSVEAETSERAAAGSADRDDEAHARRLSREVAEPGQGASQPQQALPRRRPAPTAGRHSATAVHHRCLGQRPLGSNRPFFRHPDPGSSCDRHDQPRVPGSSATGLGRPEPPHADRAGELQPQVKLRPIAVRERRRRRAGLSTN